MFRTIIIFICLPALIFGKKCTNPTNNTDSTTDPTTTTESTTPFVPTTEDIPPPTGWPSGRYSLIRAGASCPQFFNWRQGTRYQDSEDFRNGNNWPQDSPGLPGRMKSDGYEFHYCSKNKNAGRYHWPEGNYCIARFSKRCPRNFQSGFIKWDDENTGNFNTRRGVLPNGVYNEDTTIFYCCRDDGDAAVGISLPVTRPFYLYRYTDECQKVRKMDVIEDVIQFDDEDTGNQNNKTAPHPMLSGGNNDHKISMCLYQPRIADV